MSVPSSLGFGVRIKRHIEVFFVILTLIGAGLFALSTLVTTPYTTLEPYSYSQLEGTWGPWNLTLGSNETRQLPYSIQVPDPSARYNIVTWINHTVLQIKISRSAPTRLQLFKVDTGYPQNPTTKLLLNESMEGDPSSSDEYLYYEWTPPGPALEVSDSIQTPDGHPFFEPLHFYLILENLGSTDNHVSFEMVQLYNGAIGQRTVTKYQPVIDAGYAYGGLVFILAAAFLESASWTAKRIVKNRPE
jgi:hypothetical protein